MVTKCLNRDTIDYKIKMSDIYSLLKANIVITIIGGNMVPGFANTSNKFNSILKAYSVITLVPIAYSTVTILIMFLFKWNEIIDFSMLLTLLFINIVSCFNTIYFLLYYKQFDRLLQRFNEIHFLFINDPIIENHVFDEKFQSMCKVVKKVVSIYAAFYTFLPVCNGLVRIFQYYGWFGIQQATTLIFESPKPTVEYPFYFPTYYLQFMDTIYCCLKPLCSDSFFITMFLYITMAFKHLRVSMETVFYQKNLDKQDKKSDFNNPVLFKLKYWVRQHQELLSASRDLICLYIPVLFVYLVVLCGIIVFTAFTVIESSNTHTITAWVLTILFLLSNLGVFLALCLAGDLMTKSGEQVLELARWDHCRKEDKNNILIIGQMVKKPLRVCIFSTMEFDLSNRTFIWVLKSTLSYYLALVQIQDINSKQQ